MGGDVHVGLLEVCDQFVNLNLLDIDGGARKIFRFVQRHLFLPSLEQVHDALPQNVKGWVTQSGLIVLKS